MVMKTYLLQAAAHLKATLMGGAPAKVAGPTQAEENYDHVDVTKMREILRIVQREGQPRKRWFNSVNIDLSIWYDTDNKPVRMEMHYDVNTIEKSFSWKKPDIFTHDTVQSGYGAGRFRASTLVGGGKMPMNKESLAEKFDQGADRLPQDVRDFVHSMIREYPNRELEAAPARRQHHDLSPA